MRIRTESLSGITIRRFLAMRQVLDFSPPYQREGGVWSPENRARLIDSIINGFDLPKLYFERASTRRKTPSGLSVQYAVLDGKQRLESISQFVAGRLPLPDDFWFYENDAVEAKNLIFPELQKRYPLLAERILDYELPVVGVIADSTDLVEEMFQRLNASSSLNAAERRNAVSGPTRDSANRLAEHRLLRERSPIKNARYKYRELGAKFLAIEEQLANRGRIADTKAATLYELFVATKPSGRLAAQDMDDYEAAADSTLERMFDKFVDNDPLLSSIGTVVVYYLIFRDPATSRAATRAVLERFEDLRRAAAQMSEEDDSYARPANARLREYNVFVQSTNDGRALSRRSVILSTFIEGYDRSDELSSLDELRDADETPDVDADED